MAGDGLCFCGSKRRHNKCHPDISEDSLAAKMLSLYAKADSVITGHYVERKTKPLCRKGCGECCGILFNISIIEFFLICREMKNWDNKKILQIKNRVIKGIFYLNAEHPDLFKFLRSDHTDQDFANMTYRNYNLSKNVKLDCPFLNELPNREKVCLVYKVRPLLCRIFGTSYYTSMEDMYICSKITTNKKIMDYGPNTEDIWRSFIQDILTTKFNEELYRESTYPLIYWLYLALNGLDNLKEYLKGERHDKYFQMPCKEAKEKILLSKING